MNNKLLEKLEGLRSCKGYWVDRITAQLRYAVKLSKVNKGEFDDVIKNTIEFLDKKNTQESTITKQTAKAAEKMIISLTDKAKKYTLICPAHAHIDMNWMWGYPETAATAMDTFRTMLDLMKEYPQFKFSQSQASVYEIVEKYDPGMLDEIKQRIKEGRWEVTASTWVEADKNMPNGESHSRHILYAKSYLSKLLDIPADSMQLDFEPDTFGHSKNIPEILSNGGVKYYYHCRGYEGANIYRWEAPSGNSVIVYKEPLGYNSGIDSSIGMIVPEFCDSRGIDSMLKVYGVGDHGGGPTRRDVERLLDMDSWPVYPNIKLGTFREFFDKVADIESKLPVETDELNFVFSGCYTTQTRIKLANRISESRLYDAEAFSAISSIFAKGNYPGESYKDAWQKTLFNQFHDILTGSGVIETREYAMGQFQQALTAANSGYIQALRHISSQIDTSKLITADEENKETVSEGAGTGFAVTDYGIPQAERGYGKNRIFHLFNPSSHERTEAAEITVWDWPGEIERIRIKDLEGNIIDHQITSGKAQQLHPAGAFWGHKYVKMIITVTVPAFGYNTYILDESEMKDFKFEYPAYPRTEKEDEYVFENDIMKVRFDKKNAAIISMVDKEHEVEYIDPDRPAGIFRLIEEDTDKGMTSWIIGRYMNIYDLNKDVKIKGVSSGEDKLRQWIAYEISFRESVLNVVISLDRDSSRLDFAVECDWQERAKKKVMIPQLNFFMPFLYECDSYKYDVPFGVVTRKPIDMDVPGNSFAVAKSLKSGIKSLSMITDTKYGFRGYENSLGLDLVRSSYDPDPYPDNGIHKIRFAVMLTDAGDELAMVQKAFDFNHAIWFVSGRKNKGKLPATDSFMSLKSRNVMVSSIKVPEVSDGNKIIIRFYEVNGETTDVEFGFQKPVKDAWFVDINENRIKKGRIEMSSDKVGMKVKAFTLNSICIEFE